MFIQMLLVSSLISIIKIALKYLLQLFKKPHPQKKLSNRLIDTYFFHQLDVLRPSLQPVKGC